MFITKLRNSSKPDFSDQNSLMFFSNDLFRFIYIGLILIMMSIWCIILLSWWGYKLLSLCLIGLLLNRLIWRIILLLVVRLLMFFLIEIHSLMWLGLVRLLIRIHLGVRTRLLLGLLHVFKTIAINFDVDFPVWLLLVNFFYDLVAKIVVPLDHDKSVTKSIKCASSISLNDSLRIINKVPDISHFRELAESISDKRLRN